YRGEISVEKGAIEQPEVVELSAGRLGRVDRFEESIDEVLAHSRAGATRRPLGHPRFIKSPPLGVRQSLCPERVRARATHVVRKQPACVPRVGERAVPMGTLDRGLLATHVEGARRSWKEARGELHGADRGEED